MADDWIFNGCIKVPWASTQVQSMILDITAFYFLMFLGVLHPCLWGSWSTVFSLPSTGSVWFWYYGNPGFIEQTEKSPFFLYFSGSSCAKLSLIFLWTCSEILQWNHLDLGIYLLRMSKWQISFPSHRLLKVSISHQMSRGLFEELACCNDIYLEVESRLSPTGLQPYDPFLPCVFTSWAVGDFPPTCLLPVSVFSENTFHDISMLNTWNMCVYT